MNHLVSVIIPCYNSERTIKETLDSVLAQTYNRLEVIVVDDGSVDGSKSVIEPYLNNYDFIEYIAMEKNSGVSVARNMGIDHAKGKYIVCLDSDDKIAPAYIEKCARELDADPNVKIVYANARHFEGLTTDWIFEPYNFKKFLCGNCIYVSAMFRREDFLKYGPYNPNLSFYEDWSLWISILSHGGTVKLLDEILFFYRIHQDQTSKTDLRNKNIEIDQIYKQLIYDLHKDVYFREFGSVIDILNNLNRLEIEKRRNKTLLKRLFYKVKKIIK